MTEDDLRDVLATVHDPEIGENLVALGLVERIVCEPGRVAVTLIPTSATCPMADVLVDDATAALQRACPAGTEVVVEMDWEAQWDPQRLAPELKQRFGW